jgi:hypothetical protein
MTTTLPDPTEIIPGARHRVAVDTEALAADAIAPRAGTLRALALEHIRIAGAHGLTDGELAASTGKYLYTMAPRRVELVQQGWVEDSGVRRSTEHGKTAAVWVLTQAAIENLKETS